MSRSHGTGSPVWFRCHRERRGDYHPRSYGWELTGRWRPYHSRRPTGSRSLHVSFEYRCDCGHVGWSNHVDVGRRAGIDKHELWRAGDQEARAAEWAAGR